MYLIQTVQSTWRPQLPLPKELQLTDEDNGKEALKTTTASTTTTTASDKYNEPEMERLRSQQQQQNNMGSSAHQFSNKQKWSFGRLFRKKKDAAECSGSSSEEDRKAGFVPAERQSTAKSKSKPHGKAGRSKTLGFDHIVRPEATPSMPPPNHSRPAQSHHMDNEFFLPVEMVQPEPFYQNHPVYQGRSSNSLDRRTYLSQQQQQPQKSRSAQRGKALLGGQQPGHSSEEEIISLNSSTFSKYRSDESIHSGGLVPHGLGQSRRSRAARNERYYKRLSRDGEVSHGGVPAQQQMQHTQQQHPHTMASTQRYQTQPVPLSIHQSAANPVYSSANNAGYTQWRPLQNSMQNDSKRSISYDSQIHLQNVNRRLQSKPLPPPPPPRDPLRRVHVGYSSGDLRPVSYAFDQGGRCVSDERMWQPPHYQSVHSINSQPSGSIVSAPANDQTQSQSQSQSHHRRFISRSERNALPGKKSLPNGIDFHYVADATPRSRKPIHMLDSNADLGEPKSGPGLPISSGGVRTSRNGLPTSSESSWQPQQLQHQQQHLAKPRSISSSRLAELRSYPIPMYSEVQKPKRSAPPPVPAADLEATDPDNVVCGSLHIKPSDHGSQNYVEIRNRDVFKVNPMPYHNQRCSGEDLPNKYEEYVAEKREQHQQAPAPVFAERKISAATGAPIYFPRKKPANLEEAINELEAIYKSLGLSEPPEAKVEAKPETKAEPKPRMPTPSDFEKFALTHADDYDDEDSPAGEPDPVRDDVAFRQLQLANLQHRAAERQPPFGIPVGPIVPAPQNDYLHVEAANVVKAKKKSGSPDIIKDDLAVRTLRKDPPGPKSTFVYPILKKQRATRTQSVNIYNLIQRDAAKPSGGDLSSYMELTRSIERAGSMSNLAATEAGETSDIPGTLDLLRKLKAQDEELNRKTHIHFRHPSQGGAIAQLPERLSQEEAAAAAAASKQAPVPAPRKSLTPEPLLEDALNKIAQDAQASSIKLTQELDELRKEALITAARPKLNAEEKKLEEELQEIEAVSEAAKRCGQLLLDTLSDNEDPESKPSQVPHPRKMHKEGTLIRAIDEVSEAANAVCEKILKDIITTEPPVVVHEALQVKQRQPVEQLVTPHLIKKLDPIQSDNIEAIAKRCMRQISELAESSQPDYDNLASCNIRAAGAASPSQQEGPADATLICPVAEAKGRAHLDDIDHIMQECERQARQADSGSVSGSVSGSGNSSSRSRITNTPKTSSTDDQRTTAPSMSNGSSGCSTSNYQQTNTVSTTASSFSSSSDCLVKSSSPSHGGRPMSSSLTSFNPYSSSDYIKSQSSEYHAPSTDPIKTFSTTSYDVLSTPNDTTISTTTQSTNSTTNNYKASEAHAASPTPSSCSSAPLQLTPVGVEDRAYSSSPSQYNSSEELAAIFGIEEKASKHSRRKKQPPAKSTGNGVSSAQDHTLANAIDPAKAAANAITRRSSDVTNPRSALATQVQASPTNPVVNVNRKLDLELDVNATSSSSSSSSSNTSPHPTASISINESANNFSSHSSKLATIPELEQELHQERQTDKIEPCLKLSPNFNRIYANQINIIVSKPDIDAPAPAALTQFESLSSLEEISSNPDSGNASLAEYPLIPHSNACLELQTNFNSRFEVREHYVSEVSLGATESTCDNPTKPDQEFPRLPTEEELLDSLREDITLSPGDDDLDGEVKVHSQYDPSTKPSESPYDAIDFNDTKSINAYNLDEISESELVENAVDEAFEELRQDQLSTNEDVPCKKSIVYETPQINLNISEVKLTYGSGVTQEPQVASGIEVVSEGVAPFDTPIEDALKCNGKTKSSNSEERCKEKGSEWETSDIKRRPSKGLPAAQGELPTSSCKALSVFGELRTVAAEGAAAGAVEGAATRVGLTTLENILVAYSVGFMSPNDWFTLCIIVIGVILILAIAIS